MIDKPPSYNTQAMEVASSSPAAEQQAGMSNSEQKPERPKDLAEIGREYQAQCKFIVFAS
jgi:hypothetical protein